jgi:hypothetical protein
MLLSSFFQRRVTRMGGADVLSEGLALEADVASSPGSFSTWVLRITNQ